MFDQLFTRRSATARHQAGPASDLRVRYLEYLSQHGMCRQRIREVAARIYQFATAVDLDTVQQVSVRDLERSPTSGHIDPSPEHVSEPAWTAQGDALCNQAMDAFLGRASTWG